MRSEENSDRFIFKTTNGGENWFDISPDVSNRNGAMEVLVSPANPDEIWACTVFDGVYKSLNGGLTWNPFNDSLQTLETATIRYDSINNCLYLGVFYDGIYKRNPNTPRWEKIGYDIHLSRCRSLSTNFSDPSEFLVAASNGLFISSDYGESWSKMDVSVPIGEGPQFVLYDKYMAGTRYLSTYNRGNNLPRTGFYVTTDFGASWQSRRNGLPDEVSFSDMVISSGDSLTRRIFITSTGGLFFSDNLAETWQESSEGLPAANHFTSIEVWNSDANWVALGYRNNKLYLSSDRG
jgi:photosystem II stability/assembly factor-like uncharacterized protein